MCQRTIQNIPCPRKCMGTGKSLKCAAPSVWGQARGSVASATDIMSHIHNKPTHVSYNVTILHVIMFERMSASIAIFECMFELSIYLVYVYIILDVDLRCAFC